MERKNILLIGFMGTGKSTVSSRLKAQLGMNEVDTDKLIEKQQGMQISNILRKKVKRPFEIWRQSFCDS